MSTIHILLADDHVMLLEGIKLYLEREEGLTVCAMVQTGQEVMAHLENEHADVVIIDINMAETNGLTVLRHIKELHPDTKVIVLSMYQEELFIQEAIQAGADGYVFKSRAGKELTEAVRTVMDDGAFFPELPNSPTGGESGILHSLTKREKEILLLLCDDLSTKELADRLFTSVHTIETHRRNLLRKVGVHSVNGLVSFAERNRLFLVEN